MPKEGIYTIEEFILEPGFENTELARNWREALQTDEQTRTETPKYRILHEHLRAKTVSSEERDNLSEDQRRQTKEIDGVIYLWEVSDEKDIIIERRAPRDLRVDGKAYFWIHGEYMGVSEHERLNPGPNQAENQVLLVVEE